MANVPVTGLSALGAALADVGENYQRTSRQDQLLARQRAQQLEDVQAAQTRQDANYSRSRADQLEDVKTAREFQTADREDQRLYAESMAYLENSRKLKERAPFESNLQRVVDDAGVQLAEIEGREREVQAILMAPTPQVGPNDPAVLALAQQMAGGSRNREAIAAMVPQALERLNGEAMMRHVGRQRGAQEVLQNLKAARQQLTDLIQSGIQQRVAPSNPPPRVTAGGGLLNPEKPLKSASPADLEGALKAIFGAAQKGGAITPAGPQLIDNPTNNPVIARGNEEVAKQQAQAAQATLNDVIQEGIVIQREKQQAGAPRQVPTMVSGPGSMAMGTFADPIGGAQAMANILKREAMNEQKRRELQAQLQGSVPASVTPPQVNTALFSTPVMSMAPQMSEWWKSGQGQ